MYVSQKDLETISELSAFVDGALESSDGVDEHGNSIPEYWKEFSIRTDKLQQKMMNQNNRQQQNKRS